MVWVGGGGGWCGALCVFDRRTRLSVGALDRPLSLYHRDRDGAGVRVYDGVDAVRELVRQLPERVLFAADLRPIPKLKIPPPIQGEALGSATTKPPAIVPIRIAKNVPNST